MRSHRRFLGVVTVVLGACDVGISRLPGHVSADGGGPDADTDMPDAAMCVPSPDPPTGTCAITVTHCVTGSNLGAFRETLLPIVDACGIKCGTWKVDFTGGCVTAVSGGESTYGAGTEEDRRACLEKALLNARFDCVPCDGPQELYTYSCTLG